MIPDITQRDFEHRTNLHVAINDYTSHHKSKRSYLYASICICKEISRMIEWEQRCWFRSSSSYIDASNPEQTILRSWTGKTHRESFRIGVVHSQNKPLREWKLQGKQTGLRAEKYMENTSFDPEVKVDRYTNCCKEHDMWQQNPLTVIRLHEACSFKLFGLAPAHSSHPLGRVGSMTLAANTMGTNVTFGK